MEKNIIISDIFHKAWNTLKANIWILVGLFIGYTIINTLISAFSPFPANGFSITGMILGLINLVLGLIFGLGYIKNLLQAIDGEEPQFSAYGQMSRKIFTYFFAGLIYGLIVCIGLAFLIVPGIYLAIRLQFFFISIVEENTGVVESLKRSWEITQGASMQLFLLMLVSLGIVIAGFLLFLIGIFIAIPLISLMYCYAFRKLTVSTVL